MSIGTLVVEKFQLQSLILEKGNTWVFQSNEGMITVVKNGLAIHSSPNTPLSNAIQVFIWDMATEGQICPHNHS